MNQGFPPDALRRIILTASGGAFRDWPAADLVKVGAGRWNTEPCLGCRCGDQLIRRERSPKCLSLVVLPWAMRLKNSSSPAGLGDPPMEECCSSALEADFGLFQLRYNIHQLFAV